MDYNLYMQGVDLSDQPIQYYSAQLKVMKWYQKLFLLFLNIASTMSTEYIHSLWKTDVIKDKDRNIAVLFNNDH